MKIDLKNKDELIRLGKFAFVGVFNTLIDWAVYFVLYQLCGVPATIAQVVGYICGIISSFIGNKFFTFKSKSNAFSETWKFVIVNLLSLAASELVIYVTTEIYCWNGLIAKIPATCVSMIINYLGSRLFVFKKGIDSQKADNNDNNTDK